MAESVSFKRKGGSVDSVSLTLGDGGSKEFKLEGGVLKTADPAVIAALRADPDYAEQRAAKASTSDKEE